MDARGIIRKCYYSCIFPIVEKRRNTYHEKNKNKLKNIAPSIISANCFGGVVYHDLGLQFLSPTINLCFSKKDFFSFANHLKEYLQAELIEESNPGLPYPIGLLSVEDHTIRLHFMHYSSFEEAKSKWYERRERVNFNNISVIMQVEGELADADVNQFEQIPYENKVLLSQSKNRWGRDNIIYMKSMDTPDYEYGKVLKYKSPLSVKRYMDEFDYVSFLNKAGTGNKV